MTKEKAKDKKLVESDAEIELTGGGRTAVSRKGNVVYRETGSWANTVHLLLNHLEKVGFSGSPRVVGSGFDGRGRETLSFIHGKTKHPGPWSKEAMPKLGQLLRQLHQATESFSIPDSAVWRDWHGRNIGDSRLAIGHCDMGPWNIIEKEGAPVAMIDWEVAGPVDPSIELAQTCWLNAQLHDDDIAEQVGLSSLDERANHVRLILDGYKLPYKKRSGFVDKMIELAIQDAAVQVIDANVTPETKDISPLWGITWRTRSASWMLKNRVQIEHHINRSE